MPDIELPPGVIKTQSRAAAIGRYIDLDKVRFSSQKPEKIRGWRKMYDFQVDGVPRSLHAYLGPAGIQLLAIGTERKLYVVDTLNVLTDITPLRVQSPTTLGTDPLTTTNLSNVVTVSHPEHGFVTGQFVKITGALVVGGITVFGNYQVTVTGADSYTIVDNEVAASNDTGGGDDVVVTTVLGNNPFAVTLGSNVVTVTHTDHGALAGDYVTYTGAFAGHGVTVTGEYQVESVIDVDTYTIIDNETASGTGSIGGADVLVSYQISVGLASSGTGNGYGIGPYGAEEYGTERSGSVVLDPTYWSLDNYGTLLLAARQTGRAYFYDDETDTRAEAILNSPEDVRYTFVTEERYIFALCQDMFVRWADQDDPTDWEPVVTNTANIRRLQEGSRLIAGASIGGGVSLVWTDTSVYLFQYTGDAFIYSSRMVGDHCGLAGPGAFCTTGGYSFWMSETGFHTYAGGVSAIPNSDDVADWVFGNLNVSQASKITCWFNSRDREVWWTYPDLTSFEPNRYVAVNVDEWTWIVGTLDRTGATHHATSLPNPVLASPDGFIYEHELEDDYNADGASMPWFLETGRWRIEGAGQMVDIFGFSPDFESIVGTISLTVSGIDRPHSSYIDFDTVFLTGTTQMADLRVEARYFSFRMEQDELNGMFRLGVPVLEVQNAGYRR